MNKLQRYKMQKAQGSVSLAAALSQILRTPTSWSPSFSLRGSPLPSSPVAGLLIACSYLACSLRDSISWESVCYVPPSWTPPPDLGCSFPAVGGPVMVSLGSCARVCYFFQLLPLLPDQPPIFPLALLSPVVLAGRCQMNICLVFVQYCLYTFWTILSIK